MIFELIPKLEVGSISLTTELRLIIALLGSIVSAAARLQKEAYSVASVGDSNPDLQSGFNLSVRAIQSKAAT